MTNPQDCMCEEGCGWAPLEGMCISGTPDYPSNQTVTVVQWETKGCPHECQPQAPSSSEPECSTFNPTCCPASGPRSQCYRASYNEKPAFAPNLMDEYAVMPATHFPANHPAGTGQIPGCDMWSRTAQTSGPDYLPVNGSVAFFAYSYPNAYSSNTGYEAEDAMVTFLVQGDDCQTYLLVLLDRPGSGGGAVTMSLTTTGVPAYNGPAGAPIVFLNDPQMRYDSYDSYSGSTVTWDWEDCCNDGMVIGPLPYGADWSVNMQMITSNMDSSRGLGVMKIGTYDASRNDVGFITTNIQKATSQFGGLSYSAMECTSWCQRYTDCAACFRDDQCQFSSAHGGCISRDAYIYDFGCPRPTTALTTRVMMNSPTLSSALYIRYSLPSTLDMTCPCAQRYTICVTIYLASTMEPVTTDQCTAPRMDYQFTYVDFASGLTVGTQYHAYSYLCVQQGTLGRDDCSPVTIDTFTLAAPAASS